MIKGFDMSNTEKKLDALIDALGFDVKENVVSESLYRDSVIEYKITKRNPKQTQQELIIELAQALWKHSITAGVMMHTLNYNGITLKHSFISGVMEIVTNEEI
tara:strand:+ start:4853 stop:5161 length:309 start_codon:yes stop_codon:yes gene_type:complete